MHVTIFYSHSCRICVVQFLFSEVYNSFAHSINLVLLHYWLVSFQKRFASLCYTSLDQTSHHFALINSVYTNHRGGSVVASRLRRVTKFCLLTWDLPIILWVTFRPHSLLFFAGKCYAKQFSQIWRTCFLWFVVSRFRILDSGFWIPDFGFRFPIPDSGFLVLGLPLQWR